MRKDRLDDIFLFAFFIACSASFSRIHLQKVQQRPIPRLFHWAAQRYSSQILYGVGSQLMSIELHDVIRL